MSRESFKTSLIIYLVAWFFLSFPISSFALCEITDDHGVRLHFSKPAQRIISLAPDITEILFSIGAGHHVIGVIENTDYPEESKKITKVGSYTGLDLERIVSLHPDLIVTWSSMFSRQLTVLKRMGMPVYMTDPHRLEDIPRTMIHLGCLTGTLQTAKKSAERYTHRLIQLHDKYQHQKLLTVFYQIGSYSLITINKNSWINQVITLCGGENIFANARFTAPEVTWESVVTANPQVILSDVTDSNWKKRWQAWPQITAVKQDLMFSIPPDLISRAGPRLLDGVEQVCVNLEKAHLIVNKSKKDQSQTANIRL